MIIREPISEVVGREPGSIIEVVDVLIEGGLQENQRALAGVVSCTCSTLVDGD